MTESKLVENNRIIRQIADRAVRLYERYGVKVKPEFIVFELRFVHEEIVKLRLQDFLDADDFNFAHDIGGIHGHIDIRNNQFTECFLPRFAETRAVP
jgi:hypothetical protein